MRYGIKYPDGSFSGEITDQFRLAQAYARDHDGVVYDIEDQTDPVALEVRQFFGGSNAD